MDIERAKRKELLDLLYYARSFFDRLEDFRNQYNSLKYKQEIPHESPKGHIVSGSYSAAQAKTKEWKKWKGVSGFFKTVGIWLALLLVIFLILGMAAVSNPSFGEFEESFMEGAREFLYQNGVSEIGEVYQVQEDGTLSNHVIGDAGRYYWWDFLEVYLLIAISIVAAVFARILINLIVAGRNEQMIKDKKTVAAREQAIHQENLNIANYNRTSLVEHNREIDKENLRIQEHNRDVVRKREAMKEQLEMLRNEMESFVVANDFPPDDFCPEAIDFYINEVINRHRTSIKECAIAYEEYKRHEEKMRKMDEQTQAAREQVEIGKEQLQIGKEQLQWQKISAFMQVEQIFSMMQNIAAVNRNTDAVNRNGAAIRNSINDLKDKIY